MSTAGQREAALAEARRLAERLSPQAAKQAASALAIVRRRGLRELEAALRLDPPAGGDAKHWSEFRKVITPEVVRRISDQQGDEAVPFVLGWVKRLGVIKEASRQGGTQQGLRGGGYVTPNRDANRRR